MADICVATVQGVIPNFNNAIMSGNLENEEKAYCNIKLSVATNQQGDDGKYKNKIISVVAFRKTAITLAKCAKVGTGLILECDIMESRPLTQNGQSMLDQAGKQIYSGLSLAVRPFGVHFQRNYSQKESENNNITNNTDPLQEVFGTESKNNAKSFSDDFDGFDFM